MKKVAIENTLMNFKDYLEKNNVQVDILDSTNKESTKALDRYDAVIVTGADENLMGMQNIMTTTRIINAEGMTVEEVYKQI